MSRSAALALGALLVAALVVPAAGVGFAQPESVLSGTPRVLPAGPSSVSGFDSTSVSVGPALSAGLATFDGKLRGGVAAERIAAAESEAERRAVARSVLDGVGDRLDALRARERQAYRGRANGSLSTRAFVVELAHVHAVAAHLNDSLAAVADAVDIEDDTGLVRQRATLAAEQETLTGPVRGRLLAALRGERSPTRVFVETSEAGVVLATVDDEVYIRETFRADYHDANGSTTFDTTVELGAYVREFYPWIADGNSPGSDARRARIQTSGIHFITLLHVQGQVTVAIDGSTRSVFREVHQLEVDRVPTRAPVNATNGSASLSVARTYPGGPMRVSVETGGDSVTGVPVVVDGQRVGRTGTGGQLWTLTPPNGFAVTAVRDAGNVTVSAG